MAAAVPTFSKVSIGAWTAYMLSPCPVIAARCRLPIGTKPSAQRPSGCPLRTSIG